MCRFSTCKFKKVFVHECGASFCADTPPQQFQMFCHKRNKWFDILLVGKHLSYYDLVAKEIADQLERIGTAGLATRVLRSEGSIKAPVANPSPLGQSIVPGGGYE